MKKLNFHSLNFAWSFYNHEFLWKILQTDATEKIDFLYNLQRGFYDEI